MIELRLLGAIEVRASDPDGNRPALTQPKRLALLAYLALAEPAGFHPRDRLLAMLWPEADDASSRHSLRNALHALRRSLGPTAIQARGESWIGLEPAALRCDVLEVRAHLGAGRIPQALALYTGELMPGFHVSGAPEFDRWLETQRTALSSAVRIAAWNRADELQGRGAVELEAVRHAVQIDPGNERGARRLMLLLDAAGDRGGALRAYQSYAHWIAHELDAEPSAETRTLAERLRVGNAESSPVSPVLPPRARTHALPVPSATSVSDPAPAVLLTPRAGIPRTQHFRRLAIAMGLFGAFALGGSMYVSHVEMRRNHAMAEARAAVLRLPERYRADTSAYSSYLRGLTLRFEFEFMASRDTLAALVERKPLYVPGLYGLAHAWIFTALTDLTDADESWPKIDALARRALALDSTAASAWLVLASEDMFVHRNLTRAGERISHARRLDPLDPDAAGMRSSWFRFHGDMARAVEEARLAHRLDPMSLLHERLVAKQLFFARRYEESRQSYMRLLQDGLESGRSYTDLAQLAVAEGRNREAIKWLRSARIAAGDSAGAAALPDVPTERAAIRVLEADNRRTLARLDKAVRDGKRVRPNKYAIAFAALRDTTATLNWLDSMLVRRDNYTAQVRVDPVFDFVRREPRYREWELRTGLPPMPVSPGHSGSESR